MTDLVSLVLVTILAYLATNMDNVALLVALFARFRGRATVVFAGHLLAVLTILVLASLAGEATMLVDVHYLGYLGSVPLVLGSYWLYRSFRPVTPAAPDLPTTAGGKALAATFLSLVANSVDTFLTLTVLFADTRQDLDLAIGGTVFAMAILLGLGATYAVSRPALGPATEWFSKRVAPLVMIGVGLYVLADTATDVL
ncbi:MAG: cadmium resistance transporter [Woeseiaceae bacterium]|jgi:cadmium resistance protein CadD (predicted permease)|nr:cadmium resistance transporter [Woeseiaceae bacterium]